MSWRYRVGSAVVGALDRVLPSRFMPLVSWFPRGIRWAYDVQRFAGTRQMPTVFDVGANIGQTVEMLTKYFPSSDIYSFEPVAETFETLQRRWSNHPRVHCVRAALGNEVGRRAIMRYPDNELNSFVPNVTSRPALETEEVAIETVDSFCAQAAIDRIDILKMDVQGHELEVLRGAKSLLDAKRIRFIYSEVTFRRDDVEMQHFGQLNDFLEQHDFFLCGFYEPSRWGPCKRTLGFCNALYQNIWMP